MEFEKLTIEKAKQYKRLWDGFKQMFPFMHDIGIKLMVEVAVDTCSDCYENPKICTCWDVLCE